MASLQERVIGALRLESRTFEEVEADQHATGQAMLVVIAAAVAAGIGAIGGGPGALAFSLITALVGWLVWAFLTFIIGTKVLPEPGTNADMGQMLRVLGFAAAPGLFSVLEIVPFLGWLIALVVVVWQLMAMVVAVRQGLDYSSTARAVLVCLIGWLVNVTIAFVFGRAAMMSSVF